MQTFDDLEHTSRSLTECLHLPWTFSEGLKDYKDDLMMDRLPLKTHFTIRVAFNLSSASPFYSSMLNILSSGEELIVRVMNR